MKYLKKYKLFESIISWEEIKEFIDKLRKYNIEDFFECYEPGIYIQLYDSGSNYSKMPIKKIEKLFDENLPRILDELEYEKILWEIPRDNRQFDENSYELYDFTIKILLK